MPVGLEGLSASPINRQKTKFLIAGGKPTDGTYSDKAYVYDWYGKTWTQVEGTLIEGIFQHRSVFYMGDTRNDDKVMLIIMK